MSFNLNVAPFRNTSRNVRTDGTEVVCRLLIEIGGAGLPLKALEEED